MRKGYTRNTLREGKMNDVGSGKKPERVKARGGKKHKCLQIEPHFLQGKDPEIPTNSWKQHPRRSWTSRSRANLRAEKYAKKEKKNET